ncbi:uncharacterized protein A4U43_C04F29470 [Asparagus officinalis]|uniref:Ubiquitin-like protease family profile domain-containing protein n=1 Tax=Asparagus officinalis TaxID=4686 RepID=A0A5P1F4J8_ASPOF|nr:uncharacterized protein A4U43_C04F29470 [Asparagus officinalis]
MEVVGVEGQLSATRLRAGGRDGGSTAVEGSDCCAEPGTAVMIGIREERNRENNQSSREGWRRYELVKRGHRRAPRHWQATIVTGSKDQPKEVTKKKRVIQILDSPEGSPKKKCINEEGFIPRSRNYPGKTLVSDYEDKVIDNFLQLEMTSDTYVWKYAEASVSRLDAYRLLTGGELSDDVIDAFVIRLCYKIETTNSYDRKIHVTRPWLAQAFLKGNIEMMAKRMKENVSQQKFCECERILIPIVSSGHWHMQAFLKGNIEMMAKRMKENVSQQKFCECERILIPIVSSGHWHMVELVREEKKFYHYSSIKSSLYTADAAKFKNKFMSFIESNWTLGKLEHHELVSVAAPQQGPTLDCGIFVIEFINSIVEKRSITISQGECAKYRAKFCAALLVGVILLGSFVCCQEKQGPHQAIAKHNKFYNISIFFFSSIPSRCTLEIFCGRI